ncbi:hypothetical protein ABIA33_004150 [Streptacidiphilus sp. MAP12-16]|uniref:DUF6049 family protein n=1 Tax=Streptacidiphilus sp. MAP12-16 TaxID=3156300 RepID=UPI0035130B08
MSELGIGRGGERAWQRARRAGTILLAAGLTLGSGTALAPAAGAAQFQATGAVSAQAPTAARAGAGRAPASVNAHYPAVVTLSTISPSAPQSKDTLTVTGTVTNAGSVPITSLHVGMWVSPDKLSERSQIAAVASITTPQNDDPPELDPPHQQSLPTLAPGATSAPFTLTVKISDLNLDSDHVYQLAVDAQGSVDNGSAHPLGIVRTFLPLFSSTSDKPTQVATLWPLADPPRVQPQTYTDPQQAEQAVLTDDTLASELGVEGRLGQLQLIGNSIASLKPTWVIDPDLVSTVLAMETKYQVVNGDDTKGATAACKCTTPGTGLDAAKAWRTALQAALTGLTSQQVISLPAADPDLASIAHNTAAGSSTLTNLKQALGIANSDLGQVGLNPLQVSASHTVAWPYQGYTDSSVFSLAHSIGDTQIIANSASLPDSPGLTYTPNAARSLGNGMTGVVADSTLAEIFAGDLSTPTAQTMAEQRFLAETLAITLEQPGLQRSILVQPPRDMSASTAQTLAKSLKDAVAGKWITPVSFGTVAQATPTKGAGKAPTAYPSAVRKSELSGDSLTELAKTQDQLDQLANVVVNPAPLRTAFGSAILRSVSTQWRTQAAPGATFRSNAVAYLTNRHEAVSILPKPGGTVTLPGSSSATIPITVQNDLPQGVRNLQVELTSDNPTRLSVGNSASKTLVVTTGGNTKLTLKFPVQAFANGPVPMTAQLFTSDQGIETMYGLPVSFNVEITQLPSGVIAVMAGGGLLVLLAGLRLYWKRKKNAALDGPDETGDGPDDVSGDDPTPDGTEPRVFETSEPEREPVADLRKASRQDRENAP